MKYILRKTPLLALIIVAGALVGHPGTARASDYCAPLVWEKTTVLNCKAPIPKRERDGVFGRSPSHFKLSQADSCASFCKAAAEHANLPTPAEDDNTSAAGTPKPASPKPVFKGSGMIKYAEVPNDAWSKTFDKANYKSGEVYTDIKVKFRDVRLNNKRHNSCRNLGLGANFVRSLFGTTESEELTLSMLVSGTQITDSSYQVRTNAVGFVIPLFSFKYTNNDNCQITQVLVDDQHAARVLASSKGYIRVLLAFTETSELRPLGDLASSDGDGLLTTLLNGQLNKYGEYLSQALGKNLVNNDGYDYRDERSISTYPKTGKNKLVYRIEFGSAESIEFEVFQDPAISEDGNMREATTVREALEKTYVTPQNANVFTGKENLDEYLETLSPSDSANRTDATVLKKTCRDVDTALTKAHMSKKAKERFLALMMSEFEAPDQLQGDYTICLNRAARHRNSVLLQDVIGTDNDADKSCRSTLAWAQSRGRSAADFLASQPEKLAENNHLRSGRNFIKRSGKSRSESLLISAKETVLTQAECFYPRDVPTPGNPECEFLFLTEDDNGPLWVSAEIREVRLPESGQIQPHYKTFALGVPLGSYISAKAGQSHSDSYCRSAVADALK